MTILCTSLSMALPLQDINASPADFDFYQQGTPLRTVLKQIGSHYKVAILFEESLIQGKNTEYKFNPSGTTLEKTLGELLTPLGLKASKVNDENYVVIAARPVKTEQRPVKENDKETPATSPVPVNNQTGNNAEDTVRPAANQTINGRVVNNEKEEPIASATVSVMNSNVATTTDAYGNFSLRLPAGAKLISVSHVAFNGAVVAADAKGSMLVRLTAKANTNSEVVVLGLFKRPKENFTGAATSVSGDQLRQVNSINALEALKVFDPSIRIPENTLFGSDPNRLPNITIRGTNNFPQQSSGNVPISGADFMANYATNPNQPLFILDGQEVSIQKVYDLDITRIANFTVLKDAAATSIYGSRASNGVIVVDTKQPEAGKLRLNYSGMMQITGPDLSVYDLTDAAEKLEVERLAGLYSTYGTGIRPDADAILRERYASRLAAVQRGVNTYWLSKPLQTGFGTRHSLFLEGGDSHFRYGIDLAYNRISGVMKNSDRTTYSGAMNFSYRNKNLIIKNVLSVAFNEANNSNYGLFSDYLKQNPYWSPYDSNGNYVKILETITTPTNSAGKTNFYNPLYNTTLNTVNRTGYSNVINQTSIDWTIGNGFRLTGSVGITKQSDESDIFLPSQHTMFIEVADITKKGSYTRGWGDFFAYDASVQLDYGRRFGRHHLFNTTGANIAQTESDYTSVYVEGFPNQRLTEIVFGNGYPPNSKPSGSNSISRRVSGFSNFNYSYDGRYQADLSISADGSSQFGINNRFAPFWSLGTSWNLHKEKYLRQFKHINELRIRATIGTTGDSRFPPFMGVTTYRYYTDQSIRGQLGAVLLGYGNPNLKWQQAIKRNIGLNATLFQNRLNIVFDVYRENTKSLILDINTPPSVGVSSYRENVGQLENKGYEFRANVFVLRNERKNMTWSVFFNGSHNTNKIKQISNALKKQNENNDKNDQTRPQFRYQEGMSVNAIWAVRSLGIDPSNGREVYLNRFDSMTYIWDPRDKVVVGDAFAKLRGNFGSNFTWKGLTAAMYFSYEFGGQIYNQTLADRVEDANLDYNVDRRVLLGRWKTPGDATYFKGLVDENGRTVTTKTNATSRFVQKNNYVHFESVTLGYMLPAKLNKTLGLNNTRISFTMTDLHRWSSIQVERGTQYPFARDFTINISTQF